MRAIHRVQAVNKWNNLVKLTTLGYDERLGGGNIIAWGLGSGQPSYKNAVAAIDYDPENQVTTYVKPVIVYTTTAAQEQAAADAAFAAAQEAQSNWEYQEAMRYAAEQQQIAWDAAERERLEGIAAGIAEQIAQEAAAAAYAAEQARLLAERIAEQKRQAELRAEEERLETERKAEEARQAKIQAEEDRIAAERDAMQKQQAADLASKAAAEAAKNVLLTEDSISKTVSIDKDEKELYISGSVAAIGIIALILL